MRIFICSEKDEKDGNAKDTAVKKRKWDKYSRVCCKNKPIKFIFRGGAILIDKMNIHTSRHLEYAGRKKEYYYYAN
jgi:hypothetical protein